MASVSPFGRVAAVILAAAFLLEAAPVQALKIEADEIPTGLPLSVNLYAVGWRPDGKEAVAVGDSRAVVVYRDSTGSFRRVEAPSAPEFLLDVAWKPDSGFALAVGSGGAASLYNGETVTTVATGTTSYLYDVGWWPDGSAALVVGSGGTVLRYAGGVFSPLQSGVTANLMGVACHPMNGSALAVGLNSTFLMISPGGAVQKFAFEGDWSLHSVAWNPQGTLAVITGGNGIVATYDGTAIKFINRDRPNVFLDCCWKPDGSQALVCGETGIILRLAEGRLKYVDPGIRIQFQGIAYRPDGSYALAVGNKAKCVRYPMKEAPRQPGLLDNPLVLGGTAAVVATAFAYVVYREWRDRRELRSKKSRADEIPRPAKKRRR
jgi:hypothetical protein